MEHIRVVVYVLVMRNNRILMGKRKGGFGEGEWAMPAGHLEFNEAFEECARRELQEETGLTADRFDFVALRNQHCYTSKASGFTPRHYVILGMVARDVQGEPRLTEPNRCFGWEWIDPNAPPEPMFEPARMILECYLKGQVYIPDRAHEAT